MNNVLVRLRQACNHPVTVDGWVVAHACWTVLAPALAQEACAV